MTVVAAPVIALGKPVAVFVLVFFLAPSGSVMVLVVATLVAAAALRVMPARYAATHELRIGACVPGKAACAHPP